MSCAHWTALFICVCIPVGEPKGYNRQDDEVRWHDVKPEA